MKRAKYIVAAVLLSSTIFFLGCSDEVDSKSKTEVSETSKKQDDTKKTSTTQKPKKETVTPTVTAETTRTWKYIAPEDIPDTYDGTYCNGCGKDAGELVTFRAFYCDSCLDKYKPYGSCEKCGTFLDNSYFVTTVAKGHRCYDCITCDVCGTFIPDTEDPNVSADCSWTYDWYNEFICESCYVSRGLEEWAETDGMCINCHQKPAGPANAYCGDCGAEVARQSLGPNDGLSYDPDYDYSSDNEKWEPETYTPATCPQCGQTFNQEYLDICGGICQSCWSYNTYGE